MASTWEVLEDSQRPQWVFTPFENVGPLRFGMKSTQVREAAEGSLTSQLSAGHPGKESWITFGLAGVKTPGPAVTAYFDKTVGLACVVVHAAAGPQVTLDGMPLVAQVPSVLEDRFQDYATAHDKEPEMSQHGDPGSELLGLVIRSQRAGDIVLTRPVFVAREWAERCCHVDEGHIPREEWNNFSW